MSTPFGARLQDVTVRFANRSRTVAPVAPALDQVSLTIRPGVITGLLGRNGAGKTTLLSLLAAFRRPTMGSVLVGTEGSEADPWENPAVTSAVQLVREGGDVLTDEAVRETFKYYASLRPGWDTDLASRLLDLFEVDEKSKPSALSRGKRSVVGAVVGLASRAPLTIFDEVYLGMDAPTRYAFYEELLTDYAEHPRTILLSSHLVEEVERLFEDVVILDRGRVLLAESADAVRARGVRFTGPALAVDSVTDGLTVLNRQQLGPTVEVTVDGALDASRREAAQAAGVSTGAVPLQDLFVHLTRRTGAEEVAR